MLTKCKIWKCQCLFWWLYNIVYNNGNCLGISELISHFDSFLKEHKFKYGNQRKGIPLFLFKSICEEIIHLTGKKVLKTINEENTSPNIIHCRFYVGLLTYWWTTNCFVDTIDYV